MTSFNAAMRKAANLTRSYNLVEATRVIQDALSGRHAARDHQPAAPLALPAPAKDLEAKHLEAEDLKKVQQDASTSKLATGPGDNQRTGSDAGPRRRRPLGEVVRMLREGRLAFAPRVLARTTQTPDIIIPTGAQYLTRSFTSVAGVRNYKLYIPANSGHRPRGLILMLHGCRQNPDDFAVGTAMNNVAEQHGLVVAYPHQTAADNSSSCWNWFRPADQTRGQGEPAILAGIARELASEFKVDREQTFAAGLSAGGAMAMVMAETYPDVFGAVGVHSGLDYKSASDVVSAFAAMRGSPHPWTAEAQPNPSLVRTIVFHGRRDTTVHPSNAERMCARLRSSAAADVAWERQRGDGYSRVTLRAEKAPLFEHWSVDNLGHAWSGGDPAGSFTDRHGPQASAEMVRFFLRH